MKRTPTHARLASWAKTTHIGGRTARNLIAEVETHYDAAARQPSGIPIDPADDVIDMLRGELLEAAHRFEQAARHVRALSLDLEVDGAA